MLAARNGITLPFMKRKQMTAFGGFVVMTAILVLAVAGCETSGGGATNSNPAGASGRTMPAAPSIDEVRVGDRLTITFTDVPQAPPPIEVRVPDSGEISLPLDVKVQAAGKKTGELAEEIRKKYDAFYRRLSVNVRQDDRFFYVGGAVRKPDRHQYAGEMTLLGAIKAAGDFTDFARRTKVLVVRQDGTRVVVDCKKALKDPKYDVPIYPNDNIYVPQRTGPW